LTVLWYRIVCILLGIGKAESTKLNLQNTSIREAVRRFYKARVKMGFDSRVFISLECIILYVSY